MTICRVASTTRCAAPAAPRAPGAPIATIFSPATPISAAAAPSGITAIPPETIRSSMAYFLPSRGFRQRLKAPLRPALSVRQVFSARRSSARELTDPAQLLRGSVPASAIDHVLGGASGIESGLRPVAVALSLAALILEG